VYGWFYTLKNRQHWFQPALGFGRSKSHDGTFRSYAYDLPPGALSGAPAISVNGITASDAARAIEKSAQFNGVSVRRLPGNVRDLLGGRARTLIVRCTSG
jgi:hypothetical protein